MRILIIKLSSIGDLIHTFPAIIDAKLYVKDLIIDWMVDEDFFEIIDIYKNFNDFQAIEKIITIPLRKIKRNVYKEIFKFNVRNFLDNLRSIKYDLIIDPQGLLKSAILTMLCKSHQTVGFNFNSCREKLASFIYNNTIEVNKNLHAIFRTKKLFADSLNYPYQENVTNINYGLDPKSFTQLIKSMPEKLYSFPYIVLLYGTSWESKHWHTDYWSNLCKLIIEDNKTIVMLVKEPAQQQFAEQIAIFLIKNINNYTNNSNENKNRLIILSQLNFFQITVILANAVAIVAVDTGFAHLAASMKIPVVAMYGPTSKNTSGILGNTNVNLQSNYHCSPCYSRICLEYYRGKSKIKQPCFLEITPQVIFNKLKKLIT